MLIRLRELRESRGLTLEQVAEALDLRNQYVSNYELGKRRPDFDTLKKFADFYNVSIDYILGRENISAEDQKYMRAMQKAKDHGISPADVDLAVEFLARARERDKKQK